MTFEELDCWLPLEHLCADEMQHRRYQAARLRGGKPVTAFHGAQIVPDDVTEEESTYRLKEEAKMKIEVYEKGSSEETLRLALVEAADDFVYLLAVDENGEKVPAGILLGINENGFSRFHAVSRKLGLPLNSRGEIAFYDEGAEPSPIPAAPRPHPSDAASAPIRPTPSEVDDLWVEVTADGGLLGDATAWVRDGGVEDAAADVADSHDTYVRALKLLVADGALSPAELLRAVQLARVLL